MPLTILRVKKAKPETKPRKLFDGGGLHLLIHPAGGKYWRLKYRFNGKHKVLALGIFPEVSLAEARDGRDAARKLLRSGIDPGEAKKAARITRVGNPANSFEAIAREWHAKFSPNLSPGHATAKLRRLELDVFPTIGARPIDDIKAPEILRVLRRIEERGALEMAHRLRGLCGEVFRYAVVTGRADRDPCADLRGALPPAKTKHFAAITDPKEVGALLRAIDGYSGSSVVKWALQLAPLVFVRPGELRQAEWPEIDFDAAEWTIPSDRMKTREPHLVPLSMQAVAILKEAQTLTGSGKYVFPSHRSRTRPMSNNAVLAALRRMGFDKDTMTGHGFRATARTMLEEKLQIRPDIIEHQLAHAVRDPLGRAYNRTTHLPERRTMMQQWADFLDSLKQAGQAVPRRDLSTEGDTSTLRR
jgi:integrase